MRMLELSKKEDSRMKHANYEQVLASAESSYARNDMRKFFRTVNNVRSRNFPLPVM